MFLYGFVNILIVLEPFSFKGVVVGEMGRINIPFPFNLKF